MKIKINGNGTVDINVADCILETIDSFPKDIKNGASAYATRQIFNIRANQEKMIKQWKEIFHSLVAKLLWIMKRGRPDIGVPISFLSTRV